MAGMTDAARSNIVRLPDRRARGRFGAGFEEPALDDTLAGPGSADRRIAELEARLKDACLESALNWTRARRAERQLAKDPEPDAQPDRGPGKLHD